MAEADTKPTITVITNDLLTWYDRRLTPAFPPMGGADVIQRPTSSQLGEASKDVATFGMVIDKVVHTRCLAACEAQTRTQLQVNQRRAHLLAHVAVTRGRPADAQMCDGTAHFGRRVLFADTSAVVEANQAEGD